MTLMTAMTMNCRGSLNGVRHSAVESRDRAMGREHSERKCDKARRCSRLVRPLGDRRRDMLGLHPAAKSRSPRAPGPRPACPALPPRAALAENAAQGLCYVSTFYTTLVKKSHPLTACAKIPCSRWFAAPCPRTGPSWQASRPSLGRRMRLRGAVATG
jgi:hypothetical protein